MIRWRSLVCGPALLLMVVTSGCSALTPFATAPLAAKPGVTDPGSRVAICFNTFKTPPEKVQELAQAECLGNTVAERVDTDYRMDDCPALTPGRATFVCKPAK
jgi:hypothetical protein